MDMGTKGRILFLERYLLDYTDDEHSVSIENLIHNYEENGYKANRHTIKDDINTLNASGTEIISEREGGSKAYYHVGARLFELAELKMLVDAVSSSRFITKAKSDTLIKKLTELTNKQNRPALTAKIFTANQIKTTNPVVFQTVDTICKAIDASQKISFRYYFYTPEKQRVFKNEGKEYVVSPLALIWNDDRYYLAAQNKEMGSIVTFRIDRIHGELFRNDADQVNFDIIQQFVAELPAVLNAFQFIENSFKPVFQSLIDPWIPLYHYFPVHAPAVAVFLFRES